MRLGTQRIAFLLVLALVLAVIRTGPALSQDKGGKADSPLWVDAEYVRRYRKQNPSLQLVDVRSSHDFERTHIPGSIHVPLSLVPHKSFLQSGPVVLVGGGADPGPLLRICRKLRRKGVQASVLWGGLARWSETGGRLTGERTDHEALNKVSPAAYYRQRGREYWRVLYVGNKRPQELDTALPSAEYAQLDKLASHFEDGAGPWLILLVTRKGEDYDRLESILRAKGIANVFCLRGGLTAYAAHLKARRNIEERKSNQTAARSKCPGEMERNLSDTCAGCGE